MLNKDPNARISLDKIFKHPWIKEKILETREQSKLAKLYTDIEKERYLRKKRTIKKMIEESE
jgi:hypothetical protein